MRDYTAEKYIKLVENIDDPTFQAWQNNERDAITKIRHAEDKTFIDLGAGYGRILPVIAKIARNVILIEINPCMLGELKRRTAAYKNATVIQGNLQKIEKLLENKDIKNPVLLLLQNTLGTIEGDYMKVLYEMKIVADKYQGEIIISLLRQEALKDFGVKLYTAIKEMTGEPAWEKTDFGGGLFVSKTGYTSKWWSSKEIEDIKNLFGGRTVNEIQAKYWAIVHLEFAAKEERR